MRGATNGRNTKATIGSSDGNGEIEKKRSASSTD